MDRVGDAAPDVDLGGVVVDDVEATLAHERRGLGRADVKLDQSAPGGTLANRPVERSSRMTTWNPAVEQGIGDVRADEPRAAGDQGTW